MKVGILGGGQLGWMTVLEGRKLGHEFYVLDKSPNSPAVRVADGWYPPNRAREFSDRCDVITYEFEHIDENVLSSLGKDTTPPLEVLRLKKSRILEKRFLLYHGYPVAPFEVLRTRELTQLEFRKTLVAKAQSLGYDGKGQYVIESPEDLKPLLENHGPDEEFLVEEFVDFSAEVSLIGVRDYEGRVEMYPVSFNYHREGILLYNYAPYDTPLESRLKDIVSRLMEDLKVVGLLAVEFFITKEGEPLVNEFAPRPHNTGHYTLDGAYTSQFENLLRAITGLPLGSTDLKLPTGMVNLLGVSLEDFDVKELLSLPGVKLYWYGKEKRPKRKLGHVNVCGKSVEEVKEKMEVVLKSIYGEAYLGVE